MPLFDPPPEQLRRHVTELAEPADLDGSRAEILSENGQHPAAEPIATSVGELP